MSEKNSKKQENEERRGIRMSQYLGRNELGSFKKNKKQTDEILNVEKLYRMLALFSNYIEEFWFYCCHHFSFKNICMHAMVVTCRNTYFCKTFTKV